MPELPEATTIATGLDRAVAGATIRAARLLGEADVVVYDRLVGPRILELARPRAQRIYVGKAAAHHVLPQKRSDPCSSGSRSTASASFA